MTTSSRSLRILLLAGEHSGDRHGARLARALRARLPGVHLLGMGGEEMAGEGVELLAELDDLAVMGFAEVVFRLPFFWRLERRITSLLDSGEVDLVLPIDYPGFNLRITRNAHERGIPVVFYIAPQVWAWKAHRARKLARDADRIAVILPFEEEIFRQEGGRAEFVGHPLLEREGEVPSRSEFSSRWGLDPDRPVLAVFPGSREQELRRHLIPFLGAALRLQGERPELQLAVAELPGLELGDGAGKAAVVRDGWALLHHARAALVKSGTTTLEAALARVPFVVAYRTSPLTFQVARRLVKVSHVALANLVAGERVVPELLQSEVRPELLANALRPLLDEGPERARMLSSLAGIRERLGSAGASTRVAELVREVLVERGVPGIPSAPQEG